MRALCATGGGSGWPAKTRAAAPARATPRAVAAAAAGARGRQSSSNGCRQVGAAVELGGCVLAGQHTAPVFRREVGTGKACRLAHVTLPRWQQQFAHQQPCVSRGWPCTAALLPAEIRVQSAPPRHPHITPVSGEGALAACSRSSVTTCFLQCRHQHQQQHPCTSAHTNQPPRRTQPAALNKAWGLAACCCCVPSGGRPLSRAWS